MVLEKLPPHDVPAEEAVLASLLVDPDAMVRVVSTLKPQDFFREKHGRVYDACLSLFDRNEAINEITVAHELARREQLEDVGGLSFLSQIVAELPTTIGVEFNAGIIRRDSLYRQLISVATQIARWGYDGGPDFEDVINRAENMLLALRMGEEVRDFVHIRALLSDYLSQDVSEAHAQLNSVRSGFVDLDTLLGGFKRSDLAIVAARPGMGKTSLGLSIARNAARAQGAKVAIFSVEMSAEQLVQRLLAAESGVDSTRLRLGEQTDREERLIIRATGVLSELDIFFDDTPALHVAELRAKARRLQMERGLNLIIIDYLQLLHGAAGGRGENRVQEVSYISRSLKELARELEVPVIATAQLSRSVEGRTPPKPVLSDLRESGSIEQDADVVMFIYREEYYQQRDEWMEEHPEEAQGAYPKGLCELVVAKHRNGPTGSVFVRFKKQTTKFEDLLLRAEEDGR
jgi:replicative DNA helicase